MNRNALVLLVVGVLIAASGVFAVAMSVQHRSDAAEVCKTTGANHVVQIQNDTMQPVHTSGKLCDTLTVKNFDDVTREIGFGEHEHHTAYDGVTEKVLKKDQSFTVTMSQKGTFVYHDHFHDEVAGTFTVE